MKVFLFLKAIKVTDIAIFNLCETLINSHNLEYAEHSTNDFVSYMTVKYVTKGGKILFVKLVKTMECECFSSKKIYI